MFNTVGEVSELQTARVGVNVEFSVSYDSQFNCVDSRDPISTTHARGCSSRNTIDRRVTKSVRLFDRQSILFLNK